MFKVAVAFLLGVVSLTVFQALPHWYWCFAIIPAILMLIKYPPSLLVVAVTSGFLWALAHGYMSLYPALDKSLEGKDLDVIGKIISIPSVQGRSTRFEFLIHSSSQNGTSFKLPKKVRLNWYGAVPQIRLGEIWQLRVRLKRPWGFANPGSFDYEKWLFEKKIRATGYVRAKGNNQRIKKTSLLHPAYYFRATLNEKLDQAESKYSAIIKALVLGERGELDSNRWQVLTQTGTNHLLAISGLHVGIVSGFIYFMVLWLCKHSETLCLRIPAQKVAALAAIGAAVFYAMLAGFSIPTQRAMIMASIVFLSIYTMQSFRPWNILSLALICVLIVDPFSVLSPGFWLSFAAVAIILFSIRNNKQSQQSGHTEFEKQKIKGSKWLSLIKIQFVLTLGLFPITLLFFQQASLISPIANLFAVPWISILVVPLTLAGSMFLLINETLGAIILQGSSYLLDLFWVVLRFLHSLPFSSIRHAIPSWVMIPAVCGLLLILAPKGFPLKVLGVVLLSPIFFAKQTVVHDEDLYLFILDVGQGTAVVLQSGDHVLVYDTGPKFSASFNAGDAVIATFLRERGINIIDTLVVSHGDKDHAGGLDGLFEHYQAKHMIVNQSKGYKHDNLSVCREGMHWKWNAVDIKVLNPTANLPADNIGTLSKNNSSCVLHITHSAGTILLTGDIEKKTEKRLVKKYKRDLAANVLLAPHHGSNSSSISAFIEAVSPDYVVFTTGYRNPYGFPDEKVISRYKEFGVQLANSASQGMISFELSDKNGLQLQPGYRELRQRFWHSVP